MLLALTTTDAPATDLGYLLHKNPERVQSFEMPFGSAHVSTTRRRGGGFSIASARLSIARGCGTN